MSPSRNDSVNALYALDGLQITTDQTERKRRLRI